LKSNKKIDVRCHALHLSRSDYKCLEQKRAQTKSLRHHKKSPKKTKREPKLTF